MPPEEIPSEPVTVTAKAFGYVRLSQMDEGTTSPQRQRKAITKWCKEHGATLVETFEDLDRSAYRKGVKRPGFEKMLARLGEVDVVVRGGSIGSCARSPGSARWWNDSRTRVCNSLQRTDEWI
jgi:hypothetical protein